MCLKISFSTQAGQAMLCPEVSSLTYADQAMLRLKTITGLIHGTRQDMVYRTVSNLTRTFQTVTDSVLGASKLLITQYKALCFLFLLFVSTSAFNITI